MIPQFEAGLYELARLFLLPALVLIVVCLTYAAFALGAFALEAWQRRIGRYASPLMAYQRRVGAASEDLELWIMKSLEAPRVVSRSAPLLGLIATMAPMGPALLALSRNDARAIGDNLVLAFSGVILALVAASVAHLVLTIRRRWLLEELRAFERGDVA